MLTEKQLEHLRGAQLRFSSLAFHKYEKGVQEHGGNLWDKDIVELLDEAISENIDQFMYLHTARENIINERTKRQGRRSVGWGQTTEAAMAENRIIPDGQPPSVGTLALVSTEVMSSRGTYPKLEGHSYHHYWGVLDEEVIELKEELMKRPGQRDKDAMRREAVQIAAVMIRFIEEVLG